jgi:hypothetical protein
VTDHAEVEGIERGDDAAVLAEIVKRVEPADVAQRMVARFRSEIAGYQRLPEPVIANQILEISRQNVELFFRSILEGRGPTDGDLTAFRESARDRAAEGMPLEDLLHAYRLGGRLGWQAITEADEPDERLALIDGAERQMDYVDRVTAVVAQAYLDERQHLVSEEERRLRNLFDTLVQSDGEVPPGLHELAERGDAGGKPREPAEQRQPRTSSAESAVQPAVAPLVDPRRRGDEVRRGADAELSVVPPVRSGLARRRSSVRRTFGARGRYRKWVDRYCLRDGSTVRVVAYPTHRERSRLAL